jgi:hypothetical protein
VCDARDHRGVAKDGWRTGEVVEQSNARAKKNRGNVDVDFVEEASIQALLDRAGTANPDGLPGRGGFGLLHGAFEPVGHEMDCRVDLPSLQSMRWVAQPKTSSTWADFSALKRAQEAEQTMIRLGVPAVGGTS